PLIKRRTSRPKIDTAATDLCRIYLHRCSGKARPFSPDRVHRYVCGSDRFDGDVVRLNFHDCTPAARSVPMLRMMRQAEHSDSRLAEVRSESFAQRRQAKHQLVSTTCSYTAAAHTANRAAQTVSQLTTPTAMQSAVFAQQIACALSLRQFKGLAG
ncbi:MAG: hypothetical protein JWQ89_2442, partial [Devosia sp.]|nr:hypothetical protein [Devosia sp.]